MFQSYEIELLIPGSEIPKWFSHQSEGTSLNLKGPSDFMGIALCAVFVLRQHHSLPQSPSEIPELALILTVKALESDIKFHVAKGLFFPTNMLRLIHITFSLDISPLTVLGMNPTTDAVRWMLMDSLRLISEPKPRAWR